MRELALITTLALPLALAACASGGGPTGAASPLPLAYAPPAGETLTYLEGDTVTMSIDAGGQFLDVTVAMSAVLGVGFEGGGDDIEVTIDFRDFEIDASNPMVGSQRGDESGITGPLVFTIDRWGAGTLLTAPAVEGVAAQAVSPETIVASFFPPLPGRAVEPGEMWSDTVTLVVDEEAGSTQGTTIFHFTAVGDTVVAGSSYLKVAYTTRDERVSEIAQDGVTITQDVAGDGEGWYLWDSTRGLVAARFTEAQMRGTMEVSLAPMPLALDMKVVQHLRIDDGGDR